MRRITRNTVLAILVVVVFLLALGALPSYLKSGDPYYVRAESVDQPGPSVNATNLSAQTYPYTTAALESAAGEGDGRSEPYWRGPFGVKEAFTHSPFDEFDSLRQPRMNASADGEVYVSENGTRYRLEIVQDATEGSA